VEVALAGLVGVGRIEVGYCDSEDVRRSGEEKGVDVVVVESFDDGGEEVGYGSRGNDAKEEDHEDVGFGIEKGELSALPKGLFLRCGPVVFANVFLEAPCGELAFLGGEPGRGAREVGEDKITEEGDDDGGDAFNDE